MSKVKFHDLGVMTVFKTGNGEYWLKTDAFNSVSFDLGRMSVNPYVGSSVFDSGFEVNIVGRFKFENYVVKPKYIFQQKIKGMYSGLKIYYYETDDNRWWFVKVGDPFTGNQIPEYGSGTGQWKSKRQFPDLKSLIAYHKADNIVRIDKYVSVVELVRHKERPYSTFTY